MELRPAREGRWPCRVPRLSPSVRANCRVGMNMHVCMLRIMVLNQSIAFMPDVVPITLTKTHERLLGLLANLL